MDDWTIGRWTMDDGRWTMDDGRWTMDDGRWTMDDGRWTMDDGQIKHTLTRHAVCFLFLQLRHAINHFVACSSRNLDWPRSLFIYLQDMYQIQEIQPFKRYHLGFAKQR